ncbi:hypothetical protein Psi02_53540 [Planotetraspora silvatica]|uniref:Zinc finger CGNR domain-containing protein n=1 Tax=Planotetraspora silvatica TaxID=234614 RepID=A0A8J3V2S8_9ACTN|nr:CGNR zinc finger domain-containing protein [Planotetraspora silvatica]GII48930.1 hypothetical protein Psi02_53540 [Planotetraspora silvatica]
MTSWHPAPGEDASVALALINSWYSTPGSGASTGPVKVWHAERAGGFDAVLAHIARDAVDVVTGPRAPTIRRCESPGCVRIFLRQHARRIWCSTTCGDRVRAERHHRLHQAGRDG